MRFLRFDRLDLRGVASETFFSANQNWRRLSLNCVDLDWWEVDIGLRKQHRAAPEHCYTTEDEQEQQAVPCALPACRRAHSLAPTVSPRFASDETPHRDASVNSQPRREKASDDIELTLFLCKQVLSEDSTQLAS